MPMVLRTLLKAPVMAAMKAPPPTVQHIEQQLAAAVEWVALGEKEYVAAGREYEAAKHKLAAAHSIVLGLLSQWYGEQQR